MRQKRKGSPAALVYWPHSDEGRRGEGERKEEGGRNKRKGATVGEEGKGRRNHHEVKLHSFVIRHFGSMYPQLVVL